MDRTAFYAALRPTLGALTQASVVGFELVLDEAHRRASRLHHLAYILATAWWESGRTMQPVREAYWLSEAWRKKNLRYYPFYGRGLVQLTWQANYQKASDLYGVDFVQNPDLVMEPKHSVNILFDGMRHGWFTGKAMDDYIDGIDESDDEDMREFKAARRVVNGTDKATEIGKLALVFESALKAGGYGPVVIPAAPIPTARPPLPADTTGGFDPRRPTPGPVIPNSDLSPIEQSGKAVGAGKWTAVAGAVWTVIVSFDVLPPELNTAETSAAILTLVGAVAASVGAYRARDKRFAGPAS